MASEGIEMQREKACMIYREALTPGATIELELKSILTSTHSKFQKVQVIKTIYGKTLITDGKTQSSQFDEFCYHESLVHPALIKVASTGKAPETVFIGGGGELATAREVLRHKSVKRVVMVDLDGKVVDVCKEFMAEWGGQAVLDEPRFELVLGDAYNYLLETKDTFDVIIMDISDPIEAGPGVMLYTRELYEHAITRLAPGGVFVTQAGMAEAIPSAVVDHVDMDDPSCFAPIYNTLSVAFDCALPYSANIPSFGSDWGFVMAFQTDDKTKAASDWKLCHSDKVDELVKQQIDGGELKFYDGETHRTMFSLTKPLRKYIEKDNRIMTKENPIFMY